MFKRAKFKDFDHTAKGLIFMLASVFLIAVMNACAKFVSPTHNPIEVVFYRGLIGLILMLTWVVIKKEFHRFKTERPLTHIARALIGTCGMLLMFWAYTLLPMADVSALLLTSSLFVGILSGPLLGETLGRWRWGAILLGLIGAVIVASPTGQQFNILGLAAALCAAFSAACVSIFLRSLGKTESAFTATFYVALVGMITTGIYMIFKGHLPTTESIIPLIAIAITGTLSLLVKAKAYQYGEASMLAPCHYTSVIWALMLGFLMFDEIPTTTVLIGAAIIIISNLVIIWRENLPQNKKPSLTNIDDIG